VCTFAACGNRLFSGRFYQLKTHCFATSITARKKLAFSDHHSVRRAVRLMRNRIGPALGANVSRLQDWSEPGAFHSNPRNKSVASRFASMAAAVRTWMTAFLFPVVLARVASRFIHTIRALSGKNAAILSRTRKEPRESERRLLDNGRSRYNQHRPAPNRPIGFAMAFYQWDFAREPNRVGEQNEN
jgi:hypothetical protein